jgi:bla regulator protein blaR1
VSDLMLWARAIGWSLTLSLLQGAFIGGGVFVLLKLGRNWRPQLRHWVILTAQIAVFVLFVAGTITLQQSWRSSGEALPSIIPALRGENSAALFAATAVSERPRLVEALRVADWFATGLAVLWLIGVIWFSGSLIREWRRLRVLLQHASERTDLGPIVQQVRSALSVRAGVTTVQAGVSSPSVLGWIRPIVVLPVDLDATLTQEQLKAIIAHEIAHVQRGDYPLHVAESMLRVLFFFHPVMHYLISSSRATREEACDDLAVRVCGNALVYARALERIETDRSDRVRIPALALTDGNLLSRVRRLILQRSERGFAPSMLPGMMSIAALVIAIAVFLPAAVAPTVPIARLRDRMMRIQAQDPAGRFTVTMVNGVVLGATIDGRAVPPQQLRQQDNQLVFLRSDGEVDFAITLQSDGISWRPRLRASPSS